MYGHLSVSYKDLLIVDIFMLYIFSLIIYGHLNNLCIAMNLQIWENIDC